MEKLNTVSNEVNRWDMMTVVKKMQIDLDRMFTDLVDAREGSGTELSAIKHAISSLNFVVMEFNNKRR